MMKVTSGLDRPGPFPGNRTSARGSRPSRTVGGPVGSGAAQRGPVVAIAPAGAVRT